MLYYRLINEGGSYSYPTLGLRKGRAEEELTMLKERYTTTRRMWFALHTVVLSLSLLLALGLTPVIAHGYFPTFVPVPGPQLDLTWMLVEGDDGTAVATGKTTARVVLGMFSLGLSEFVLIYVREDRACMKRGGAVISNAKVNRCTVPDPHAPPILRQPAEGPGAHQ